MATIQQSTQSAQSAQSADAAQSAQSTQSNQCPHCVVTGYIVCKTDPTNKDRHAKKIEYCHDCLASLDLELEKLNDLYSEHDDDRTNGNCFTTTKTTVVYGSMYD